MAMVGADPFVIMNAMGHADFKTTMIHVDGTENTAAMDGLARSILQEPGFLWKIWLENRVTQEAGGINL
jgi:hypothetical protein